MPQCDSVGVVGGIGRWFAVQEEDSLDGAERGGLGI